MKYIEVSDAIETAWMILRGLGYRAEENPQLVKDVRIVFETAPSTDLRSINTMLDGKCGSCQFFEYEFKGAKTGFCRGKHCGKRQNLSDAEVHCLSAERGWRVMIGGDCNVYINGKMPSYSATCVECGLSRKNYKPMTNGDRIRSMSDEELADFLVHTMTCTACRDMHGGKCPKSKDYKEKKCGDMILDWLKQEAKDD